LYNKELYNLYALPNAITVVTSRSMKWERQVTHVREREVKSRFSRENVKETNSLEEQGVERRMTSREMLKRQDVNRTHRAENRDKRLAVVKRVMNLRVTIFGNFLE